MTLETRVNDWATGLSTKERTMMTGRMRRATISALLTPSALGSSSPKNSVVTVSAAVAYASPADPNICHRNKYRVAWYGTMIQVQLEVVVR